MISAGRVIPKQNWTFFFRTLEFASSKDAQSTRSADDSNGEARQCLEISWNEGLEADKLRMPHVVSHMIVEVKWFAFWPRRVIRAFHHHHHHHDHVCTPTHVESIHVRFCFHLTWFSASTGSRKGAVWTCLLFGTSHLHLGQTAKLSHCPCHCECERNGSESQHFTVRLPCYIVKREGPSRDAWRVFWVSWKFRKRLLKSASCTLMSLNGARATASKIGSLGARVQSVISDVLSIGFSKIWISGRPWRYQSSTKFCQQKPHPVCWKSERFFVGLICILCDLVSVWVIIVWYVYL